MQRSPRPGNRDELWMATPTCVDTCVDQPTACETARALLDEIVVRRALTRLVLSLVDDPLSSLRRTWRDLVQVGRPRRPPNADEAAVLRYLAAQRPRVVRHAVRHWCG